MARSMRGRLAGLAALLGLVATPLAALVPLIQPGLGEESTCLQLTEEAEAAAGGGEEAQAVQ